MKCTNLFSLGFATLVLVFMADAGSTAMAFCTPAPPSPSAPATVCKDNTCNPADIGKTTRDGDSKNIIACLYDDAGTAVWKAFTAGSSGQRSTYVNLGGCPLSIGMNTSAGGGCALNAAATHVWIYAQCGSGGNNGAAGTNFAFNVGGFPSTVGCFVGGVSDSQTSQNGNSLMVPIPKGATWISLSAYNNGDEANGYAQITAWQLAAQ